MAGEKVADEVERGMEYPAPPSWIGPFDAFLNTRAAATTLHFFAFFGCCCSALLVAMGLMVFRTGIQGTEPPLSVYTTLNHPRNQGIVAGVILPALWGQFILLATVAGTGTYGVLPESLLAAATAAAYAYVVARKESRESIAWIGMLACMLYGVAWVSIVWTITRVQRRLGAVGKWAGLCTAAYCYNALLWLWRPDEMHGNSPILLFLALGVTQCMFVVPVLCKIYRDFEVVEYVD